MDADQAIGPRAHLFNVFVWQDDLGGGRHQWRGLVEHLFTRQTAYFGDWEALTDFVRMVAEGQGSRLPNPGRRDDQLGAT